MWCLLANEPGASASCKKEKMVVLFFCNVSATSQQAVTEPRALFLSWNKTNVPPPSVCLSVPCPRIPYTVSLKLPPSELYRLRPSGSSAALAFSSLPERVRTCVSRVREYVHMCIYYSVCNTSKNEVRKKGKRYRLLHVPE